MRERAQASVETIALLAAVLALAAALVLGAVGLGPPLATSIGQAVSGMFGPGEPTAPGLDAFERLLLASATSPDVDGPTLLDLRTHLRSRLDRPAADDAFAATVRRVVAGVLATTSIDVGAAGFDVVDRATEDEWLRRRFHPGAVDRIAHAAVGLAGAPGAIISLAEDAGLTHESSAFEPGYGAGDLIVHARDGLRELILRREPGGGLKLIADRAPIPARAGVR
jgi:hypothetical protein